VRIQIILHSSLRSLLPAEAKGRTTLDLLDGSRLRDVVDSLQIPSGTVCAVNGQIEAETDRLLADGDEVRFLRRSAGG
jgi:molybdopterin converting factor small subunit